MNSRVESPIEKIAGIKSSRNAIILAHNYQRAEVQDVADFVGDSLELSIKASQTSADVIVFCGVHFMAETASILCPDKIVLLPDIRAGCPMAGMVTAETLRQRKAGLPGVPVVCYINSSAEVKAGSDICCTSANAARVIESMDASEVLFIPDQYLGHYVSAGTGKKIHLWPGYCPTHMRIQPWHIAQLRREHPEASVIVHPECQPDVVALADEILSTGGMCRYASQNGTRELIVGTETGIIHRLGKENPGKAFIPASRLAVCPNMKLTTLDKVVRCLENMAPQVGVPEDIRARARIAVDRMLEVGKG